MSWTAEQMADYLGSADPTKPREYLDSPPNRLHPPHADGADYELGERYWHAGSWWVIVTADRTTSGAWAFGARRDTAYLFEPDEWDRAADRACMSRGQYVDDLYRRAAPVVSPTKPRKHWWRR